MSTYRLAPASAADEHRGALALSAAGVLLGSIGLFLERSGADPLTAVWFRCVFGLLALSAWLAATGRLCELRLAPGERLNVLGAGALMIASWALFFAALRQGSIALATLVVHLQPFWLMVLAAWLLREPIARGQWQAAALALVGLGLASGLASPGVAVDGRVVLLALASSLLYAGVALLARRARSAGALTLAWWQCVVGSVAFAGWPLAHGWPPGAAWGWLVALGVLHTGLAYGLWYGGVARLAPGRVAVLQFVYPATAVLVDALAFGRWLDTGQLAGVALMGLGLWAGRRRAAEG